MNTFESRLHHNNEGLGMHACGEEAASYRTSTTTQYLLAAPMWVELMRRWNHECKPECRGKVVKVTVVYYGLTYVLAFVHTRNIDDHYHTRMLHLPHHACMAVTMCIYASSQQLYNAQLWL